MEQHNTLGQRIGRFVLCIALVGAVTTGAVVTQRLSQDALALLIGLTVGVLLMLPVLGLAVVLWRRESARRDLQRVTPQAANPPVIVVTPQALPPGYGMQQSPSSEYNGVTPFTWSQSNTGRQFTIVGGED